MDANRQRFWLLSEPQDWSPEGGSQAVEYDLECRRLRLRDRRPRRALAGSVQSLTAEGLLTTPSRAIDAWGTLAFWDPVAGSLRASGGTLSPLDSVILWVAPADTRVADLALGFDDVLYLAIHNLAGDGTIASTAIGLFDPRGRWRNPRVIQIPLESFTPNRLAPIPGGGVWVLDRQTRRVGALRGMPLREGQPPAFSPTTFRPVPENRHEPRFELLSQQPAWHPEGDRPVAVASSPNGVLALLSWRAPDNEALLHIRGSQGEWQAPRRLVDAGQPATIAWQSDSRIVALPAPRAVASRTVLPREAIAYDPDDAGTELSPVGGFLPVRNILEPLFLNGATFPPRYLDTSRRPVRVLPLSVQTYQTTGVARGRVLDATQDQAVWHRMYLEAAFPPRCGAIIELAASDDPSWVPPDDQWHAHLFGDALESSTSLQSADGWANPARGVWLPDHSEIPHHAGLLNRPAEKDRAGLFTALIQRPGRSVRRLVGRYLHVRVRMSGTGHTTPEIAALRVYASRFSYRDRYLPEVYHEELIGADGDTIGRSTGPDFLERLLSLFESVLTPLEDRVAAAQVLLDPTSTPDEALEWLGSWIGVVFDPTFPSERRRAWLEAAPLLFRSRGTFKGVQLALEIATGGRLVRGYSGGRETRYPQGGAVTGGEIVLIEDFRLRRTFATILGANFSVANDPLLPGLIVSANSRVGDTLIIGELRNQSSSTERQLGEVETTELLALYRDLLTTDQAQRLAEEEVVRAFYGRLAHRATIFVHDQIQNLDLRFLQRIAEREAPAHVAIRVVPASYPLLVGVASLVDVDTYLGPRPLPESAEVEKTHLGEKDFVRSQGSLDPRLGGLPAPIAERPRARIQGPDRSPRNAPVTLDGSISSAPPGGVIDRYVWTLVSEAL